MGKDGPIEVFQLYKRDDDKDDADGTDVQISKAGVDLLQVFEFHSDNMLGHLHLKLKLSMVISSVTGKPYCHTVFQDAFHLIL